MRSDIWLSMKPEALEQHISVLLHLAQKICEHLLLVSALALLALRPVKIVSDAITITSPKPV